jgi:hypothetical protein
MTYLDLDRAVVCGDCDALWKIEIRVCPKCAGSVFMPLGTWLNRLREDVVA